MTFLSPEQTVNAEGITLIVPNLKLQVCNWNTENFYAFPPFSLISRVLQKIENENAEGILIVPAFTTQPWFPRLLRLLIKPPVKLPNSRDSLYFSFRRKEQPQLPT